MICVMIVKKNDEIHFVSKKKEWRKTKNKKKKKKKKESKVAAQDNSI